MSLKYFIVPESKKVLNTHTHTHTHTQVCAHTYKDGDMSEGHRNHLKELPMAKAGAI